MTSRMLLTFMSAFILVSPILVEDQTAEAQTAQPQTPQTAVAPANPNLQKGIELNQAKKYKEAEAELRTAVTAQPANPQARLQLGVALFEQGKYDEAGTNIEQAKALATAGTPQEQADYYQYRGGYLARKEKWNEALVDLQKAIQLDPKEPYNHYHIGVTYQRLKRPDKMVEHLQMFVKLAPNAPETPKCKALLQAVQ